ncbi:glycosyltransferase [Leptolyngbya sp. FACHB-402]|nr:glycosyltransferase family 2 protein [Leptolyngbya sp. FACHB-239]MBD2369739.1 glycosyltransferase [Leptolyngbya sp. FACHB-161]MBD2376060.1 glycosyltransferase [Leptolyngbya sp. FACHB-238]MBD2400336.1 glycosyltransferase [Leptolyngbya sp. FACHB-239]MBD2406877.1 glycosyltransferase [Leptolyngbya sp. FACHB-402]
MISIITPVYNGEKFIESCLQAVIQQNCSDVEHLIMDGGSSDRTLEIVQRYTQQYAHIRWISEKDKGQSDAMNKGITLAKGEIVGFLNVDDYYEPDVLNRVLEVFRSLPQPSLVVGNCNVWNDSGGLKKYNRPIKLKLTDLLLGAEVNPHPINPSAYFYHRCLHEQIGLYNVEEHYALDVDFIFRAVQVAHVKHIDETWGNYREIEGTKTILDWRSGEGERRVEALLKSYRDRLPLRSQLQVATLYFLLNTPRKTIKHIKRTIGKNLMRARI